MFCDFSVPVSLSGCDQMHPLLFDWGNVASLTLNVQADPLRHAEAKIKVLVGHGVPKDQDTATSQERAVSHVMCCLEVEYK